MHRHGTGLACFAVVSRYGRSLAQRFATRLFVRSGAENHMAPGDFVRMKPPVIGLRQRCAEIIVVLIRRAGQNSPTSRQLIGNYAPLRPAQSQSTFFFSFMLFNV